MNFLKKSFVFPFACGVETLNQSEVSICVVTTSCKKLHASSQMESPAKRRRVEETIQKKYKRPQLENYRVPVSDRSFLTKFNKVTCRPREKPALNFQKNPRRVSQNCVNSNLKVSLFLGLLLLPF
jgi:hypothetical protein